MVCSCFAGGWASSEEKYFTKADFVAVGNVVQQNTPAIDDHGNYSCICLFKASKVIKGRKDQEGWPIKIRIEYLASDKKDKNQLIKNGEKSIVFLKKPDSWNNPVWTTIDAKVGFQKFSIELYSSVKRLARHNRGVEDGLLYKAISSCAESVCPVEGEREQGEKARKKIESYGLGLPKSATNLYYAYQPQFADRLDTWIAFSADSEDCMRIARKIAATKSDSPKFISGTRAKSEAVSAGPKYGYTGYATSLWDLSVVKAGTKFEIDGLFVLVDLDHNRVFISLRSP